MINQSKVNEALACFNDGFNCSQAILSTYCEEFGLDKKTALQLSCGLGAGMGRLGETCGAVSGAYLLIGLKYGKFSKEDVEKSRTVQNVNTQNLRLMQPDLWRPDDTWPAADHRG
ncbi:MAG: C-GCAxxG-C-C family protein [Oscillibacter sp.]|nr:C-GCAxxG-C-C family protein [Oscillibacter sp.]